jgi:DNA-binding transcriptional ArsR family regulator
MASLRHPRHELVPVLASPIRLSILAVLAAVDEMDFAGVRDLVEIGDGTLSKQLTLLEAEKLVAIRKVFVGRRPKTWIAITATGRAALDRHLDALRRVAQGAITRPGGGPPAGE